jgi:hypothetical protein
VNLFKTCVKNATNVYAIYIVFYVENIIDTANQSHI